MKSHTDRDDPKRAKERSDKEEPKLASHITDTCDMRCPETVSSSTPILLIARSDNVAPKATNLKIDKEDPIRPKLRNESVEPI